MESDDIKVIVAQVNAITATQDDKLSSQETLALVTALFEMLLKFCKKSPTFAAAIIQHLHDAGFDVMSIASKERDAVLVKFGRTISGMDERAQMTVRRISSKLFNA